jgi:hypothetical protein
MVMGLPYTIIQHHRSMLHLIKSAGTAGSSWALARDILKGTRYGLWINSCATEEQILQIERADEFPFGIPEMIKEIEAAYCTDRFFENLKNRWGTQLYKYSRSDIFQLGRWEIDASSVIAPRRWRNSGGDDNRHRLYCAVGRKVPCRSRTFG